MKLSTAALSALDIPTPAYDRTRVTPGIVHIGVGAFHRAHQAVHVDDVLAIDGVSDWGIVGVGLLPGDADAVARSRSQDHLYCLTTVDPDGTDHTRVVGSIIDHLHSPADAGRIMDLLSSPEIRIVSLTITEGGYNLDEALPHVGEQPPGTAWGVLTEALRRRRDAGVPPFTVLSCDNIQHNGDVARAVLTGFARAVDEQLGDWIEANVAFPNSMVDRITPQLTPDVALDLRQRYGIDDAWPVRSESFTQWVIEDRFPAGRPPLERVGAQLVADVAPFEKMKLRLLNASHQVMSHLGLLAGFTMVHEACHDETFARYIRRYMTREAIPTLDPVPGIDLAAYCDRLMARFGGSRLADTLARQVVDSSDRITKFLVPVIADQLRAGRDIECACLVLAAWRRRILAGGDLTDRRADELREWAMRDEADPGAFLRFAPVFGELGDDDRLRTSWRDAVALLDEHGAAAAVARLAA
ncbi:mannitol dehydrogenase family protein [Arachnia propionica]|uniref:Mannitol-1-phosphate 5-dehydrogenase n=1 Tax=Arachnia propionica TaxID=1750 RepID=A0A3P1WW15_9ACTN|nr:mannitol dehydrogenase family protein [Arachnia propionica]RRD49600.1 mannitol dehydrogenase family protein [Arachnia propionica]